MGRLEGKTALITGASQGIGKEIARLFVKEGASVIISCLNDTMGKATAQELKARYIHLDVTCEKDWEQAIGEITKDGALLDIVVNNAGITGVEKGFQDPEHTSLDDWRKVHAVNLDGVFLGCKWAIQAMKKKGGAIVNISSRSGLVGIPKAVAYASSKAAVRNHTKSVALYCCEQGYQIRCNSIHPAAILSPMWEPILGTGPDRMVKMAQMMKDVPMRKLGEPLDVAYAVLYLASEEAKYVTGIELNIDGGILAGNASPMADAQH